MMSIIRIKNNVPQNYVSESRDFQIFTRVLDFVQNGIKFNIDSITDIIDTEEIHGEYLERLKSKLGFFSNSRYDDATLRKILSAFPYIIRHKGSEEGIHMCVNTFMNIIGVRESHTVEVYNNDEENDHTILIGLESNITDINVLKDLLSFVVPTGYFVKFYFYKEPDIKDEGDKYRDTHTILKGNNSQLRSTPEVPEVDIKEDENTDITPIDDIYNTVQLSTVYDDFEDKLGEQVDE